MPSTFQICPRCFLSFEFGAVCEACSLETDQPGSPLMLQLGTRLHDQYRIGRLKDEEDDCELLYLAWDELLEKRVRLREYFPKRLCLRMLDGKVTTIEQSHEDLFAYGKSLFKEQAKRLSRVEHPAIGKIQAIFEENGTLYLVEEDQESEPLTTFLAAGGTLPQESTAVRMLLTIMEGLRQAHELGILHLGLSLQQINVTPKGRVFLSGFRHYRQAMAQRSRLTPMALAGSAPECSGNGKKAGAWSDIYGCTAALYHLLAGTPPPRTGVNTENLCLPMNRELHQILIQGLATNPQHRSKTLDELQDHLRYWLEEQERNKPAAPPPSQMRQQDRQAREPQTLMPLAISLGGFLLLGIMISMIWSMAWFLIFTLATALFTIVATFQQRNGSPSWNPSLKSGDAGKQIDSHIGGDYAQTMRKEQTPIVQLPPELPELKKEAEANQDQIEPILNHNLSPQTSDTESIQETAQAVDQELLELEQKAIVTKLEQSFKKAMKKGQLIKAAKILARLDHYGAATDRQRQKLRKMIWFLKDLQ